MISRTRRRADDNFERECEEDAAKMRDDIERRRNQESGDVRRTSDEQLRWTSDGYRPVRWTSDGYR